MMKTFSEDEWKLVWQTQEGRLFRTHLALMFTACRPFTAPAETDYRTYFWALRDVLEKRGIEFLAEGMAAGSRVAGDWRPSAGAVRAHTERAAEKAGPRWGQPQLPAKKYVPPTPEQLAEIREDIRRMPRGPVPAVLKTAVGR